MKKELLLILADGFEEIEAVATLDVLRRAKLATVALSAESDLAVLGAHGITLHADGRLDDRRDEFSGIVLPGGPAVGKLRTDARVLRLVRGADAAKLPIAAICAAPLILSDAGLLNGRRYTAHPAVWDELPAVDRRESVIVDGNLITADGPGSAIAFAVAIVRKISGAAAAERICDAMGISQNEAK
jgi:4-methyl-5(b-hydroxyethyl)-thiazole monophosphate biosynthesis